MQKQNLLSIRFEPISEDAENLLGGFSNSLSAASFENSNEANNCQAGNCASGCGSGQEVNKTTGCGTNLYNCNN